MSEDWRKDLSADFAEKGAKSQVDAGKLERNRQAAAEFFSSEVVPAFEELKVELEKNGREVRITTGPGWPSMLILHAGNHEYEYTVRARLSPAGAFPFPETTGSSAGKSYRSEGHFRSGAQDYGIADIKKDDVIRNFLAGYRLQVFGKL